MRTNAAVIAGRLAVGSTVLVAWLCLAEPDVVPVSHERFTSASLSAVIGGQGTCYVRQTLNCPAKTSNCVLSCKGKKEGDPCAAESYVQYAPSFKRAKKGVGGQKQQTEPVARLCGVRQHCGPQCLVSGILGLHCPIGTVPDYELETEPAGPVCDAG